TYGVQLFFMVSALTLLTIYTGPKFSYSEFMTRRFFRIAPAFYLAAIYTLIFPFNVVAHHDSATWQNIAATFLFIHSWFPETVHPIVPGGWSIGVEMMFYLSFPLVLRYITSIPRSLVAVVIAALAGTVYASGMRHLLAHMLPAADIDNYVFFGLVWNML